MDMIKIKIQELLRMQEVLTKIADMDMPATAGLQIATIIVHAQQEFQMFSEARQALISLYGEKNDDGTLKQSDEGNMIVEKDKIEEFNSAVSELLVQEIEIPVLPAELLEYITLKPRELLESGLHLIIK